MPDRNKLHRRSLTEDLWRDSAFAVRTLLRKPGFTAVVVLTLALGIGANTAIFSVVHSVLLRPLPYRNPDRIVTLLHGGWYAVAPANFLDWRAQTRAFERIAAAQVWGYTLTGRDRPEQLRSLEVTADLFVLLGVDPALGRTFLPGEDQPGAARTVVLSHSFWQKRFGGDTKLVGQILTLNGEGHTVVGIMPPGFDFAPFWATRTDLWVPLDLAPRVNDRRGRSLRVFARLKSGVTRTQAQAEIDTISRRLEQQYPGTNRSLDVAVDPLHEKVVGKTRRALLVLLGAVSFILLIASVNVANLLLARSAGRRKEIAIRTALGAGRLRIVRQLLAESMLLALAGGGVGVLLARWSVGALIALGPSNLPRLDTIRLDAPVFGFTLAVALLTGLFFGLAPALQASKLDLNESLREGGRSGADGARRNRMRSALAVAEVALALVLLIGAGLMIRSFQRLQAIEAGFDPHRVLTIDVPLAGRAYADAAHRSAFFRRLLPRVEALPGVESASAINHLPLAGDLWTLTFTVDGRPSPAPGEELNAAYRVVHPNYFRTMSITLLRGRDFTAHDEAGAPGVAIVNETLARSVWPDEDPIGKRIRVGDGGPNPREIVGLVGDVKQREWTAEPGRELYLPDQQKPPRSLTLVIRAKTDPSSLAEAARNEVWALDKDIPVSRTLTMQEAIASAVAEPRFNMRLLNVFAAVALVLAAVGIYGVMAYSVAERRHEIGVRLALGAQKRDVLGLVVGQGMSLAAGGVAIGLLASWALTRVMTGLLFSVSAADPATFVVIAASLAAVALLACLLPALRATKVDPMDALRHE